MKKPNVVIIMADDMGYGDFGFFNRKADITPVLDKMISQGICFSQHYSGSSVCAPSRACFFTGRYPHRTGCFDMRETLGFDRLSLDETTMGDIFKSADYKTGLIGKWHCGTVGDAYHPNARGFGEFIGFRGGWMNYYDWLIEHNGEPIFANGQILTDFLADAAIDFITNNKDGNFFLKVAFNAPHTPIEAPEEDINEFEKTGLFNRTVSTIYAMIKRMDLNIGRILSALDAFGLADDTIVMFTSDNGPTFGGDNEALRYNHDFRGNKFLCFEGGIRVPAIVRWPGKTPQNNICDSMIHFSDWLPTLAEAAGINLPSDLKLDGKSFYPLILGQTADTCTTRFWQFNRYEPLPGCNMALRKADWKVVRPVFDHALDVAPSDMKIDEKLKFDLEYRRTVKETNTDSEMVKRELPVLQNPMLFNIAKDKEEQYDLYDSYPDLAKKMTDELDQTAALLYAELEQKSPTLREFLDKRRD